MNLARQAYIELYGKEPAEHMEISYHAGFKGYNANVRKHRGTITFSLARKFETCEPEIQMGVMQVLLNKLHKTKVRSDNIDLYNAFLKRMSDFAPVTESNDTLAQSFARMNEQYFNGLMTVPNLVWGNHSRALLGTYTYATDTIMISRVLEHAPAEILDYVVYHEMLHKKHKFSCTSGRTHSHTKAFRDDEKKYYLANAEQELHRYLRSYRAPRREREDSSFVARVMDWF